MISRRLRYGLLIAALVMLAGILSGCAGNTTLVGASWPGIAVSDEQQHVYIAFGPGVYAVDPESGRQVWMYPTEADRNRTFFAKPAVADDMVVVGDYDSMLAALDPETGEALWTFQSERARFIGGATIGDNLVYAGSVDGVLHALDRADGNEAWSFQTEQDIWAQPLLRDGTLYITSLDKHLYALDAENGNLLWQFPAEGETLSPQMGAIVGTPTYYDGLLIFGSFNNYVYALDDSSRQIVWQYEADNWVWSSPIVDDETGMVLGTDLDGNIFALDVESGEEIWKRSVPGPIVGAPTLSEADGDTVPVYVATGAPNNDALIYKLDLENGEDLTPPVNIEVEFTTNFLFFQTGTNNRAIPIYTTPILLDNYLLVGAHEGDALLYALDRDTLLEAWTFEPASE